MQEAKACFQPESSDEREIGKILTLIEELLKNDVMTNTQRWGIFLYIALHEGCSTKQISRYFDMNQPTVFKALKALSKNGLNLIREEEDAASTRPRKIFSLTAKGRRIVETLRMIMAS
jgi:DNA-binding MarR family transcriptional regulator